MDKALALTSPKPADASTGPTGFGRRFSFFTLAVVTRTVHPVSPGARLLRDMGCDSSLPQAHGVDALAAKGLTLEQALRFFKPAGR